MVHRIIPSIKSPKAKIKTIILNQCTSLSSLSLDGATFEIHLFIQFNIISFFSKSFSKHQLFLFREGAKIIKIGNAFYYNFDSQFY